MSLTDLWYPYYEGHTIGQSGSEEGTILQDEEHSEGARITLERDCRGIPFAITCGIYGWLVHTRYFSTFQEAESAYNEMKTELVRIANSIPLADEPLESEKYTALSQEFRDFVGRFP